MPAHMATPPDHSSYRGEAKFPGPHASTTAWDRNRVDGLGSSSSPIGPKLHLRRTSARADAKHLHRTKSAPPRRGHHNAGTPRSPASTCSTSSTSTRYTSSSAGKHIQGGSRGTGKPFGLSAVDHEVCDTSKKDLTRAPLVAIPGYGGWQPGVHAGNIHGETFARSNKAGLDDVRAYRKGKIPKNFDPPSRWYGDYGTYNHGAEIPGYGGHVPGIASGNMVGMCTPRCAKSGWRPPGEFGRGERREPLVVGNVGNNLR